MGRGWIGDRVEGTAQPTHQPHSPPEMVGGEGYTKYDYETAWRLYREGYKPSEISRILDIPIGTIIHWIKYQASQKKYRGREEEYTLTQYYRALQLYREGYTVTEIHRILNIPRDPVREWLKRGKRPRDIEAETIGRYTKWIEKHHPYRDEYHRLLHNPEKWRYIAYLYGATLTDGTTFQNIEKGTYTVRITGEKIFLERVNLVVNKLIGRKYSIYPHPYKDQHIINITRKSIYLLMKQPLEIYRPLIEYKEQTMKAFILGLVDGDGYYTGPDIKKHFIGILKAKKYWAIAYSAYLLKKLGVKYRWIKTKEKGRTHKTKHGYTITSKRNRFGWETTAKYFLSRVGPTIKVLKRSDLLEEINRMAKSSRDPLN